jgi:putative nucleotidyltransferase with HDIG domain
MSSSVPKLVIGLAILSAATVFAAYFVAPVSNSGVIAAALWFAALSLVGYSLTYRRGAAGGTGTVAYLPALTAIVTAPTWATAVVLGTAMAISEALARRAVLKAVFNVAQITLASAVGVLAFKATGVPSLLDEPTSSLWSLLPAYLVVATSYLITNSAALSAVIAVTERRSPLLILKPLMAGNMIGDVLALPFAYVFGRIYIEYGGGGTALLAVPLVGMRQLYSTNWQLKRTNQELLELMVAAIEARDPYTSGHSRRVCETAGIIAAAIGLSQKDSSRVIKAALLHDIGKIHEEYAPILQKPGRLTSEERAIIETHSERGAELVAKVSNLQDIVPLVRHHHENWDGSGYPARLSGDEIPVGSRIIMIADTIDAMTTDRPYRDALGRDAVREELIRCSGRQFDPSIVALLVQSKHFDRFFPEATDLMPERPARSLRRPTLVRALRTPA